MIIFWCFFYTQIRFSNVALLTCFQRDNANNQTWLTFYWATPYMTKQSGYKTGNEAAMCPRVDTLQLPASLGKLQSPELRLTNVCAINYCRHCRFERAHSCNCGRLLAPLWSIKLKTSNMLFRLWCCNPCSTIRNVCACATHVYRRLNKNVIYYNCKLTTIVNFRKKLNFKTCSTTCQFTSKVSVPYISHVTPTLVVLSRTVWFNFDDCHICWSDNEYRKKTIG